MSRIVKFTLPVALIASMPSNAYANGWRFDQITRCNMPVPAPLSWAVAYIPCFAFERIM